MNGMDSLGTPQKQLSAAPKARICYICGRQYMVHSYEIHLKQCKELWIAREAQKDPRERKPLPEDPAERLGYSTSPAKGGVGGSSNGDGGSPAPMSAQDLEAINKAANQAYNTESLSVCAFCGRSFLPEKLVIHNRSCTADNPARRANDNVRRGNASAAISGGISSSSSPAPRPSTAGTTPLKKRMMAGGADSPSGGVGDISDALEMRLEKGELVGHLGGKAGRPLRSKDSNSSTGTTTTASNKSEFATKEEGIAYLGERIEGLEAQAGDIFKAIAELRSSLRNLQGMN